MQQSAGIKTSAPRSSSQQEYSRAHGGLNRDKIKKIMKFEKVIQKFCDQIGIEKTNLLNILQPEKSSSKQDATVHSAYDSLNTNQAARPSSSQNHYQNQKQIDTGKAAMLAYTNLDNTIEEMPPQSDWRRGTNTRN